MDTRLMNGRGIWEGEGACAYTFLQTQVPSVDTIKPERTGRNLLSMSMIHKITGAVQ